MRRTRLGEVEVGEGRPLTAIAGPCVIESRDQCLQVAETMARRCEALGLGYIFKASFDKANRSSIHSARGPGVEEGLRVLEAVRAETGARVTTDVHEPAQTTPVGEVVDLLQVPAFLCRQTDLLAAAARTGRPVNVKKGQFLSPAEMTHVVGKLTEAGVAGILLTERGTLFGYQRLINDFIGLGDLFGLGWPVCFDVTHSTQQPGGEGSRSGGRPDRAPLLARAAVAAGVDALFLETHPRPADALSDASIQLDMETAGRLLREVASLREAVADATASRE